MTASVVIAGGGTAGHVFPGLALGRALRERGVDVRFVGTERGLEARLVPAAGFGFDVVEAAPLVRRLSMSTLRAPVIALRAARRCRSLLMGADVVVGMGGYVSVPAVWAGARRHLPVVLHEQNAVPGLANRILSRVARRVGVSFPEAVARFPRSVRSKITVTGNPVRDEILRVREDRDTLAKEARSEFGLDEGRRTVMVFGGSQGALRLDQTAVAACRLLQHRADLQVVLITGPDHLAATRRTLPQDAPLVVRAFGYLERMDLAYAAADLVVCRAGATTIAEITACGLPAVLVPYPFATKHHQETNARALVRAGAAELVLENELDGATLARRLEGLLDDPRRLEAMRGAALAFGWPDAAARLADVVAEAMAP
jgi:UDP-N-acetylglucosamine--N-acetylmuramyl-(pentapeptide) pyrophosphoryl-undecaprenol N-acetylglucosamine transferase